MACKDGFCQEEGDGDSDAPRFYSDPLLLLLFGDLVSPTVSLSVVLKPSHRSSPQNKQRFYSLLLLFIFGTEVMVSSFFFFFFLV